MYYLEDTVYSSVSLTIKLPISKVPSNYFKNRYPINTADRYTFRSTLLSSKTNCYLGCDCLSVAWDPSWQCVTGSFTSSSIDNGIQLLNFVTNFMSSVFEKGLTSGQLNVISFMFLDTFYWSINHDAFGKAITLHVRSG